LGLVALVCGALGAVAVVIGFAAALGARRNQDRGVSPGPLSFGRHGLSPEGRAHASLFWKVWVFAIGMFLLALLAASLGGRDT
jgi:hypothetical protein